MYKNRPVVKPHHHHSSPRRIQLSLHSGAGNNHCTITNNISGSVSAATTVASLATLLLVRCACAVAVCEKKEAGTSAVQEPHRGLATLTHPRTPPLPPHPSPPSPSPCASENWVNMSTSLASHASGSSSTVVQNTQDMQAVTNDMWGNSAESVQNV